MNPWCLEKHNIDPATRPGDYIFTDERILSRVPYSWLILAGIIFALLFPGLIFIERENEEDKENAEDKKKGENKKVATENTAIQSTVQEASMVEELKENSSKVSKPILGTLYNLINNIVEVIEHLIVLNK